MIKPTRKKQPPNSRAFQKAAMVWCKPNRTDGDKDKAHSLCNKHKKYERKCKICGLSHNGFGYVMAREEVSSEDYIPSYADI